MLRAASWRGAGTAAGAGAEAPAFQEPKAFSSAGSTEAFTSPTTTSVAAAGAERGPRDAPGAAAGEKPNRAATPPPRLPRRGEGPRTTRAGARGARAP